MVSTCPNLLKGEVFRTLHAKAELYKSSARQRSHFGHSNIVHDLTTKNVLSAQQPWFWRGILLKDKELGGTVVLDHSDKDSFVLVLLDESFFPSMIL